jgi:hypothetical protein
MPADVVERRLAAILAADIAWYRHSFGALILTGVVGVLFAVNPASSANYSECMAQAERDARPVPVCSQALRKGRHLRPNKIGAARAPIRGNALRCRFRRDPLASSHRPGQRKSGPTNSAARLA